MNSASISSINRVQLIAFIVGLVGIVAGAIGAFADTTSFMQAYLFAFLFWIGLSLGGFPLLLTQHIAGGSWGATIRRPLEAAMMVLPIMALLFIPIVLGMNHLYPWMHAEYVASHPTVAAKTSYLNQTWFIIRAIIYFALWILSAWFFVKTGTQQDSDKKNAKKLQLRMGKASVPWFVVFFVTMTLAAVDWSMSLTPVWYSGIYGTIFITIQTISTLSLAILSLIYIAKTESVVDKLLTTKRLQDLGNFLMAYIIFWAYVNFAQLIIIWSNNITETNTWYVARFVEPWKSVSLFLLFFGFFATLAILISRWVKRKRGALAIVSIWAFFVQLLYTFYVIIPAFERSGFVFKWLDLALFAGIGGIWLASYIFQLKSRPIVPINDPRLDGIIEVKNHG